MARVVLVGATILFERFRPSTPPPCPHGVIRWPSSSRWTCRSAMPCIGSRHTRRTWWRLTRASSLRCVRLLMRSRRHRRRRGGVHRSIRLRCVTRAGSTRTILRRLPFCQERANGCSAGGEPACGPERASRPPYSDPAAAHGGVGLVVLGRKSRPARAIFTRRVRRWSGPDGHAVARQSGVPLLEQPHLPGAVRHGQRKSEPSPAQSSPAPTGLLPVSGTARAPGGWQWGEVG